MLLGYGVPSYAPIEAFSENGIVNLGIGITLLILANALSYLIVKSFNIPSYYGRFLGGVIIMFIVLMLSLSTEYVNRFKSALLFGIGEVIIGALDIINNKLSSSQPLLIPDPGCSGGNSGGGGG